MALGRHSTAWDISLWARRSDAAEEAARVLPHCAVSTNLSEVVESCDLAVLCTSPHAIAAAGPELKKLLPPSAIVTDAGSVKVKIVAALEPMLGGRFVGEATLNRFYILHCVAIPLVVSGLIAIHFWRVRKDGGISQPL